MRRAPLLSAFALLAALAASGCRFSPNHPRWVETHGTAIAARLTAWPSGVLAIGKDGRLYGYPGGWSQPWVPQGPPQTLRTIAASEKAVYGLLPDGQVARFAGGTWTPYAGSATWGATEIGATEDDQLLVIVGGHVRAIEGVELRETGCSAKTSVSVASPRAGDVYVLEASGAIHHAQGGGACEPLQAPARMQRIAAAGGRLLGVDTDGKVWRRRNGAWEALPAVIKYRNGRAPYEVGARDVAGSAHSTWIMDEEGSVFLLSDET